MNKVERAKAIQQNEGIIALCKQIIAFLYKRTIRKILPATGYYTIAGVNYRIRKPMDSIVPGNRYSDRPNHEYALVSELRTSVQYSDTVVVIGGGTGATSVVAAKETGDHGRVILFEGAPEMVERSRNTIALNGVEDICTVNQAVVGPVYNLHSSKYTKSVPPSHPIDELPNCDVLELDCEGAEKEILKKLQITPRVIVVETHPGYDSGPEKVQRILNKKGYEVINKIERASVPVLTAVRLND